MKKPLVLCIMDGFGFNPDNYGNAIAAANTPNLDMICEKYPMTHKVIHHLNYYEL